jgi:hypothetical protein
LTLLSTAFATALIEPTANPGEAKKPLVGKPSVLFGQPSILFSQCFSLLRERLERGGPGVTIRLAFGRLAFTMGPVVPFRIAYSCVNSLQG